MFLQKGRGPACWRCGSDALGDGGCGRGLQRVGQGLRRFKPTFQHRRRRDDVSAQRAVHALAGDLGTAVCRGDDDFHAASCRANQLRRLRIDNRRRDGNTQGQHKTQQHPACQRSGAAQGLEHRRGVHSPIIPEHLAKFGACVANHSFLTIMRG